MKHKNVMYECIHIIIVARRFTVAGSSKKGVAMCDTNVKAHAAIPKYIRRKIKKFLRDEKFSYVLKLKAWKDKLFAISFFIYLSKNKNKTADFSFVVNHRV